MCNHWNLVAVTCGFERNQYIGNTVLKNVTHKHIKMQQIEYTGRKWNLKRI
jgi:hypothetical protein